MAQTLSDVLRIMRLAVGRRNENDSDSSDATLTQYINDFVNLTMTNDVRIFEQFGTLIFTIDENDTTGVVTLEDAGAENGTSFSTISIEGFITLTEPADESVSWNRLEIYLDPGQFYDEWGVNNTDVLITGYPTQMLYYGDEFVFRTIPNTGYTIYLFGYKISPVFSSEGDPSLPYDYWLRYLAYGAAKNYVCDYRYSSEEIARVDKCFARERKLLLTRTHNQVKMSRAQPRF
jgi:hypothetical protein